jgi:opacity protein-like surface antigen
MKQTIRSLVLVGSCGFGLLGLAGAARSQNFYFNADAGVALADKVKLRQFLTPTPGAKIELDPGVRISAAGGYNVNSFFAVQAETGIIYNNIDGVTGGGNIDGSLAHVPLLVDAVLRYDKPDCKWVPYIGAGAGGDVSMIALDHVRAPSGAVVDGTGSSLVFAWQGFAGARYKFADKMSIGGAYKFFWADGASWDVRRTSGEIRSGSAQVHSFVVDFNMSF